MAPLMPTATKRPLPQASALSIPPWPGLVVTQSTALLDAADTHWAELFTWLPTVTYRPAPYVTAAKRKFVFRVCVCQCAELVDVRTTPRPTATNWPPP